MWYKVLDVRVMLLNYPSSSVPLLTWFLSKLETHHCFISEPWPSLDQSSTYLQYTWMHEIPQQAQGSRQLYMISSVYSNLPMNALLEKDTMDKTNIILEWDVYREDSLSYLGIFLLQLVFHLRPCRGCTRSTFRLLLPWTSSYGNFLITLYSILLDWWKLFI